MKPSSIRSIREPRFAQPSVQLAPIQAAGNALRPARPQRHARGGADGNISVLVDSHAIGLGKFSTSAAKHAADLRTGLRLDAFGSSDADSEKEIHELVRRLARCGLLEYRLARARRGADLVIIEPQVRDYTPRIPKLGGNDALVLSRFAYMRRRGTDTVLESPRAGRAVPTL